MNNLTDDSKVILMLCGRFGNNSVYSPLKPTEYHNLVRWLIGAHLRPADLLHGNCATEGAAGARLSEERLSGLLKRGVEVGLMLEQWESQGIWVVSRGDPDYPRRYKKHLGEKAPPFLFGAGDRNLMQGGGLAVVGSRNVTRDGESFTKEVASWCARGGMPIVSGGARGVDQISMLAALDAGGYVIGILADSLLKQSVSSHARSAIADGRLLLLSPYHPGARFTVGTAMGRNKFIYAMADYALVVQTDHKKGGTWEGACEELRRSTHKTVFVRGGEQIPVGNRKLLGMGGVPFPFFTFADSATATLRSAADTAASMTPESDLFELADRQRKEGADAPIPSAEVVDRTVTEGELSSSSFPSVFDAVLPLIIALVDTPLTVDQLLERLDGVMKGQLQSWLKHAISEKRIKKLSKPVRYVRL